jgi:hypothetical protein
MKTVMKSMLAGAAFAAATCLSAPASYAFGDAPWCAVIELGTGAIYWDCQYRTIEECAPNVVAGNRGSCTQNPSGGSWTGRDGSGPNRAWHGRHRHVRRD